MKVAFVLVGSPGTILPVTAVCCDGLDLSTGDVFTITQALLEERVCATGAKIPFVWLAEELMSRSGGRHVRISTSNWLGGFDEILPPCCVHVYYDEPLVVVNETDYTFAEILGVGGDFEASLLNGRV